MVSHKLSTHCMPRVPASSHLLLLLLQGQPLLDERALKAKLGGSSSNNHSRRRHSPPQMMLGLRQCHWLENLLPSSVQTVHLTLLLLGRAGQPVLMACLLASAEWAGSCVPSA